MSLVPKITFVSISPSNAQAYADPISIIIAYEDGDGDLGENNANVTNLFVTDNRVGIEYPFRINQLGPTLDTKISIKGQLEILLPQTDITDSSKSQSVSYTLFVKDRAGHSSNTITTSAITVTK